MLRAQFKRIFGNYTRLALGFVIGIMTVRLLLGFGNDIFNIYTLVTVGAGIGIMLRELLRIALVPRMTELWTKERNGEEFNLAFKQASALCQVSLVGGVILMASLAWLISNLDVNPENVDAARVFVFARMAIMISSVFLAPLFAMQMVEQKFGEANSLMTLERLADFIAVIVAAFLFSGAENGSDSLILFSFFSAFFTITLHIFYARHIMSWSFLPLPLSWPKIKGIGSEFTTSAFWAFILVLSFNLYLRFDTFFVNIMIGASATIAFGLSAQLLGMVRQLTYGIANGLDAVVANLTHTKSANVDDQKRVLHLSAYLQSLFTGYSVLFMFLCAEELLELWVGSKIADPNVIPLSAHLSAIMLIGMGARSLSESWMGQLNGLGKIGSYTKITLPITLLNPIILMMAAATLPFVKIEMVAYLFSALLCLSHLVFVPMAVVRETEETAGSLFQPILRGGASLPVAIAIIWFVLMGAQQAEGLIKILIAACVMGVVAAIDLWIYVTAARKKIRIALAPSKQEP